MILLTARLIKLLLVLGVVFGAIWLSRGGWGKKRVVGFAVLTVFFAFAANFVANKLPPLTDKVTLTALGEKREEAVHEEIWLASYTVDDQIYISGKSLQIAEGKWFWGAGESYVWRIETDPRQPKGLTRSVTVEIPVGWARTLDFRGSIWSGLVKVSFNGNEIIADTFSENGSIVPVPLSRSETSKLIWNQTRYLVLYAILMLGWSITGISAIQYAVHQSERYKCWMKRNKGKLCYIAIALAGFCLMIHYANDNSFWLDELLQITFVKDGFLDTLQYCLRMREITPPLYGLCAGIWYHIAPYGQQWLLLLSIVSALAASYLMGVVGERLGGKTAGVLATCLMTFSTTVWYAALEFRAYSFVLFFSALSLYCHINIKECRGRKWQACYSISLTGLAMSHYFGMLLCGLFFFVDAYSFLRKKVLKSQLCTYIFPGSVSCLWLCAVYRVTLQHRRPEEIFSGYPIPDASSIVSVLRFLSGELELQFWLLLLGISFALGGLLSRGKEDKRIINFYQGMSLAIVILAIGLLFFYGNCVNQKSTMWFERYFIILIPFITLLSVYAVIRLFQTRSAADVLSMRAVIIFTGMVLLSNCVSVGASCGPSEPYREAADWLYAETNTVFNPETIIISAMDDEVLAAWEEYYITRQGRRDPLYVRSQNSLTEEDLLLYDKVYVNYSNIGINLWAWLQSALNENYTLEMELSDIQMRVYTRNG